jgi:hypothetical protein
MILHVVEDDMQNIAYNLPMDENYNNIVTFFWASGSPGLGSYFARREIYGA